MLTPRTTFLKLATAIVIAFSPALVTGCATANYALQERVFDKEKRDILVSRVAGVSDAQGDAVEEFENALEAFRAVVDIDGGELEATYDRLNRAYKRADGRAGEVRDRVASVKRVSRDLFREWEGELDDYQDASLRRSSERQLEQTRARYERLAAKMDAATTSMDPVLDVFGDRVLYLKHNLNARSIAALGAESTRLEGDVEQLIREMEASIAEADAFIADMRGRA